MRLAPLFIVFSLVVAGCNSDEPALPPSAGVDAAKNDQNLPDVRTPEDADATPDVSVPDVSVPDASVNEDGKSCDGGGLGQAGCVCATEGQFQCFQGSGIECLNGVWMHFFDGPCFGSLPDASNCTDEVEGCKCPLLRRNLCVAGQGLQCFFLTGRWIRYPAACGDGGQRDADAAAPDADADPRSDGDAGRCTGGREEGCACSTEGAYECVSVGSGIQCSNGTWVRFADGPCSSIPDACLGIVEGCRCPVLRERVCVWGGLQCSAVTGLWVRDSSACADVDAGGDADSSDCQDGGTTPGCPCPTEGAYVCTMVGSGFQCRHGMWGPFSDGACREPDAGCTDQMTGCKCPVLGQRICPSGMGLLCGPLTGRWEMYSGACSDSGGAD
jgi:hypothetical protein